MNFKVPGGLLRSTIAISLIGLALMNSQAANAALIGVVPSYPDITTNSTDITYSFVTSVGGTMTINGRLTADQVSQTIKLSAADVGNVRMICASNVVASACNPAVSLTSYSLIANFDANGTFTGGTLSVGGYVNGVYNYTGYQPQAGLANSGTLLTATLSAMGFNGSAGTAAYDHLALDFTLTNTNGDLSHVVSGFAGGLIWHGDVNTAGVATYGGNWDLQATPFKKSFSCTGSACNSTLDTYVPVPAAVWLFGSALTGLFGFATRTTRKMRAK